MIIDNNKDKIPDAKLMGFALEKQNFSLAPAEDGAVFLGLRRL